MYENLENLRNLLIALSVLFFYLVIIWEDKRKEYLKVILKAFHKIWKITRMPFDFITKKKTNKEKYGTLKEKMIIDLIKKRDFKYSYSIDLFSIFFKNTDLNINFNMRLFFWIDDEYGSIVVNNIHYHYLDKYYHKLNKLNKIIFKEIKQIEKEKAEIIKKEQFAKDELFYQKEILKLQWYKENEEVKKEFEPVFNKIKRLEEIIKEINEIRNS